MAQELDRGNDTAHLDNEHHRVAGDVPRVEHDARFANRMGQEVGSRTEVPGRVRTFALPTLRWRNRRPWQPGPSPTSKARCFVVRGPAQDSAGRTAMIAPPARTGRAAGTNNTPVTETTITSRKCCPQFRVTTWSCGRSAPNIVRDALSAFFGAGLRLVHAVLLGALDTPDTELNRQKNGHSDEQKCHHHDQDRVHGRIPPGLGSGYG